MNKDVQRWFLKEGERLPQKVGIRPGYRVLDFGCGKGSYAIPAAKVVGNKGGIYALDRNRYVLAKLVREAASQGLGNVIPAHSIEELKRSLGKNLLHAVLLYDVIHSYYFTSAQRRILLRSITELVGTKGLISVFPRHMSSSDIDGIKEQLRILGFVLETEIAAELLHDEHYASGRIFNFRKQIAPAGPDALRSAPDE